MPIVHFYSGGIKLTVSGLNMNSVAQPIMEVYVMKFANVLDILQSVSIKLIIPNQ